MRSVWKWVGLAGVVGVAAGGVLVARDQRQRNAYSADDVREQLHRRYADAQARGTEGAGDRP
ncbi:hypothetical protein [Gordonia rhizosphera]|uniref:Uncharacterized protein n=1 Tax=Gordonia rhizosphera NBRC 16068 TaxID=1108045 RepID=K6WD26_9ACTN|nr:hypothetical protein [Gordonia rhizosphera]GAB91636.1 hypothetical protein GORHZ_141_00110 [Gordonia rhizosphera NBRC 16068]